MSKGGVLFSKTYFFVPPGITHLQSITLLQHRAKLITFTTTLDDSVHA
jgi:hypothetical protein